MTQGASEDMDLQALYDRYAEQLPSKLEEIEALWALAAANGESKDVRSLHRALHSLAGSGETFGFSAAGRQANALELEVASFLDDAGPTKSTLLRLSPLLKALRRAAAEPDPPGFDADVSAGQSTALGASPDSRLVYLVEDDAQLAQFVAHHLERFGYSVRIFGDTLSFGDAVAAVTPAAAIFDIGFPEGRLAGTTSAARLNSAGKDPMPIIFISVRGDYEARASAVKAGGSAYLTKPLDVIELITILDKLVRPAHSAPNRILIVEDSAPQAEYLSHALKHAGMETRCESEPVGVLQMLAEFNPDLILMDIYLAESRGDELARVIRQMGQYASIPIVFLSAETDLDRQLSAMDLGGDEFLTKPIRRPQLVKAVSTRVARYRELQAMINQDSLTGLSNHGQLLKQLGSEVMRAQRSRSTLSFAMIDVDHFKDVNDRYGHPAGDVVLKNLSRLLRQRLRQADAVGRYGGEEFAVVLPDTDAPTAMRLLDELRQDFAAMKHTVRDGSICVTFSAGISCVSSTFNAADMVTAADRALYQAKGEGRNRVVLDRQ